VLPGESPPDGAADTGGSRCRTALTRLRQSGADVPHSKCADAPGPNLIDEEAIVAEWPHSPAHDLGEAGAYMVTAGSCAHARLFDSPERLTLLRDALFRLAEEHKLQLEAWAVMSNHYHFVALAPSNSADLKKMIARLHAGTARQVNLLDGVPGRRVWFQYWDTRLTYERSYHARLNYVHQNPVHHGLVHVSTQYPWCSAAWFERSATPAFYRMITGYKLDHVQVPDGY
jgi:putative transposase